MQDNVLAKARPQKARKMDIPSSGPPTRQVNEWSECPVRETASVPENKAGNYFILPAAASCMTLTRRESVARDRSYAIPRNPPHPLLPATPRENRNDEEPESS